MNRLSIRLKITLWFSAALLLIVAITYFVILSASDQVIQKTIRDSLIEAVENNVDEVEFYTGIDGVDLENDVDQFIEYKNGYLEIDDDFLDSVNGVYTALYHSDGFMLYGENPVALETSRFTFSDARVQRVIVRGTVYYVFDRELSGTGLEGLWLRGVVSEKQGEIQLQTISRISLILLPALLILAVLGGYLIAGRMLKPIREISVTAAQISQGDDLKKRIEIGTGKDELRRLAHSFNGMFERLEQAFEAERQFTSDASHELRTPMSVIMAQCEYSLENSCTEEDYRNALRVIRRQGKKMSRLIDDMLVFMRLELHPDNYEKHPLDFSALTAAVCSDMALIREKGISLESNIEPGAAVMGNEGLLTRLLTNLISNAYRYGRENGHIFVALKKETGGILLTVSDDGIGIAEDEQEKIFHRFYQTDSSRSDTGTGLGLSMVKEIAEFHGGRITVNSKPGAGSTFSFIMSPED